MQAPQPGYYQNPVPPKASLSFFALILVLVLAVVGGSLGGVAGVYLTKQMIADQVSSDVKTSLATPTPTPAATCTVLSGAISDADWTTVEGSNVIVNGVLTQTITDAKSVAVEKFKKTLPTSYEVTATLKPVTVTAAGAYNVASEVHFYYSATEEIFVLRSTQDNGQSVQVVRHQGADYVTIGRYYDVKAAEDVTVKISKQDGLVNVYVVNADKSTTKVAYIENYPSLASGVLQFYVWTFSGKITSFTAAYSDVKVMQCP